MPDPTVVNTLDETLLAPEPDATFLHALVSMPYTIYGILTYSITKLTELCNDVLTLVTQAEVSGMLARTRTTGNDLTTLNKINNLADLHPNYMTMANKRKEAVRRINNRLVILLEAYENLYRDYPLTAELWSRSLSRLLEYYGSAYEETNDRRYLIYLKTLEDKRFTLPGSAREVKLITVDSTTPYIESSPGPFNLNNESLGVTTDGIYRNVLLPSSTSGSFTYSVPTLGFDSHDSSAPYMETSGFVPDAMLIETGTADVVAGRVTILAGTPVAAGLAVGDTAGISSGSIILYSTVIGIYSATDIQLADTSINESGTTYSFFYVPELTVVYNGTAQSWQLSLLDTTSSAVAITLNLQSPPWTATDNGGELRITGPVAGSTESVLCIGRTAEALGFPAIPPDTWLGSSYNRGVEFIVDGTTISRTLPVGMLSASDLATALSPSPGDGYSVSNTSGTVTVQSDSYGPTSSVVWISGMDQQQSWSYGADVQTTDIISTLTSAGVPCKRSSTSTQSVILTAAMSVQCGTNSLGIPTATEYGTRLSVDYYGITINDSWEASGVRYVWDGEYLQPPMPFSDGDTVNVYYGGALSWNDVQEALEQFHNDTSIRLPSQSSPTRTDVIRIFVNNLLASIGNYSNPLYPVIRDMLDALEEGQHSRLLQELVVFDMDEALDTSLIGRKDLTFNSEALPNRIGEMGDEERSAVVKEYNTESEEYDDDSLFELEDDPTVYDFPNSRMRY